MSPVGPPCLARVPWSSLRRRALNLALSRSDSGTQHKVVTSRGELMFLTAKIVGRERESFWFETVLESDVGKLITKQLVFVGDRGDPESIKILAERLRFRGGDIVEVPPSQLPSRRSLFHVVASWQGQPQEDAVVPAGTFRSCFKGNSVWERWVVGPNSLVWSHPAVPISGLVRGEPIEDRQPWYRRPRGADHEVDRVSWIWRDWGDERAALTARGGSLSGGATGTPPAARSPRAPGSPLRSTTSFRQPGRKRD